MSDIEEKIICDLLSMLDEFLRNYLRNKKENEMPKIAMDANQDGMKLIFNQTLFKHHYSIKSPLNAENWVELIMNKKFESLLVFDFIILPYRLFLNQEYKMFSFIQKFIRTIMKKNNIVYFILSSLNRSYEQINKLVNSSEFEIENEIYMPPFQLGQIIQVLQPFLKKFEVNLNQPVMDKAKKEKGDINRLKPHFIFDKLCNKKKDYFIFFKDLAALKKRNNMIAKADISELLKDEQIKNFLQFDIFVLPFRLKLNSQNRYLQHIQGLHQLQNFDSIIMKSLAELRLIQSEQQKDLSSKVYEDESGKIKRSKEQKYQEKQIDQVKRNTIYQDFEFFEDQFTSQEYSNNHQQWRLNYTIPFQEESNIQLIECQLQDQEFQKNDEKSNIQFIESQFQNQEISKKEQNEDPFEKNKKQVISDEDDQKTNSCPEMEEEYQQDFEFFREGHSFQNFNL